MLNNTQCKGFLGMSKVKIYFFSVVSNPQTTRLPYPKDDSKKFSEYSPTSGNPFGRALEWNNMMGVGSIPT